MGTRVDVPKVQTRSATIVMTERAGDTPDAPPVKLYRAVMSTDSVVDMPYGKEVLDHAPESVDLDFARASGIPVYIEHDRHGVTPIGRSASVELFPDRIEVDVRFGRSARAKEVQQDVDDGILTHVSVGYEVRKYVKERAADGAEVYRATSWRPHEVSMVGMPADSSAAIQRAMARGTSAVDVDDATDSPAVRREGGSMSAPVPTPGVPVVSGGGLSDEQRHEMQSIHFMAKNAGLLDKMGAWVERGLSSGQVAQEILKLQGEGLAQGTGARQGTAPTDVWEDMSAKERSAYSLVRLVNAAADGDFRQAGLERDVSEAIEKNYGQTKRANSFFVPMRMESKMFKGSSDRLRSLVASTASSGGNLVFTKPMEFIELLRNRSVTGMAGGRFMTGLTGPIAFPRMLASGAGAWRAEAPGSDDSDTDSTFDQLTMAPKYVHRHTAWSRQLLVQSSEDVESLVRNDLAAVLALAVDYAAIVGGGSNEPVGILGGTIAGTITLGSNGVAIALADLCNMEKTVAEANADGVALSFVTNPAQRSKTRQIQYFSGTDGAALWSTGGGSDQLMNGAVLGYPAFVSNQVPKNLTKGTNTTVCSAWIFGNWNELIVGTWGNGLEIIVDPYTKKKQGLIEIAAFMMADVGIRHGGAFVHIKDATG